MSRRYRICEGLPIGATIEAADRTVWTKRQIRYDDEPGVWVDMHGDQCTDRDMDSVLAAGGKQVWQVIDLETETMPAFDLDPDDYVIVTFGFWMEGEGAAFFDPAENVAQQLWRVAGWTSNHPQHATLVLDAPYHLLTWTNLLMGGEDVGWQCRGIEMYVRAEDTFRVVKPDQVHERWPDEYNWSGEWTFVEGPA